VPFAVAQDVPGGAVGEVVAVLDADDRRDGLGFGELADADFGQADMADLPLVLEQPQGADLIGERDCLPVAGASDQ
jgi:hypothetical protein